jgi:hypothetical protein
MGAKISASDFTLLLRGWRDTKRRLRVVLKNPLVSFGVFCTVYDARDNGDFSIAVTESSMIGVSLNGCVFGFLDAAPDGEPVLGEKVESGLVAVRPDFELAIMLLA